MKRIYPGNGKVLLDGGLVTEYERAIIADNESPDCLNIVFDAGSVSTREGFSKLNTTSVGTHLCHGLFTREDSSGSQTMIAFYGGLGYYLSGSTFTTIPSAQSVFTSAVDIFGAQTEDYLFLGNGNITPYKYNGAFTRHGIPAPTTTATVASQSAGALTGDYQYKYSFVNSGLVEGDVSPASTTFAAAGATLRVTIANAPASFGVNSRKIYRTEAGGTTYKLLTTISDNTTTTYDDNIADGSLGATAPTDQGEPPKYNCIKFHPALGRLFCNDSENETFLWYSESANPYVFKATNFIRIGEKAGDKIRSIEIYDNSILVFSDTRIHIVYTPDNDPTNWIVITSRSAYGSNSRFANIAFTDKIFFSALEGRRFTGFGEFSGNTVQPNIDLLTVTAVGSDLTSNKIDTEMDLISNTYVENIYAIVYKNKIYVSVVYGANQTINNRIFVYDFSISNAQKKQSYSWVPWSGMGARHFTIYDNNLYFGSSDSTGYVYKLFNGTYADNGTTAINSYFWTKEFSGFNEDTNYHKDFRFLNILVDLLGAYYMNLTYRVDSDSDEGLTTQVSLDPGGALWDTARWDIDTWGGGLDQYEFKQTLATARGKRIQFKFSNQNTVNQGFKVHYLTFTYLRKGQR